MLPLLISWNSKIYGFVEWGQGAASRSEVLPPLILKTWGLKENMRHEEKFSVKYFASYVLGGQPAFRSHLPPQPSGKNKGSGLLSISHMEKVEPQRQLYVRQASLLGSLSDLGALERWST